MRPDPPNSGDRYTTSCPTHRKAPRNGINWRTKAAPSPIGRAAAWSTVTIDKEDDNGYERTGTLGGYKSFEKFRKNGSDSELAVIAVNRFVITANCRGCEMETMRAVVQGLDLGKLKNFK